MTATEITGTGVESGPDQAPELAGGLRRLREYDAELPVGHLDEDGRLHRVATLRKMTGHEEALLADRKLRANGDGWSPSCSPAAFAAWASSRR